MKRILLATIILGSLLTACTVTPVGRHGYGPDHVVIAPFLPSIVVLEAEPYYFQSGFYYYYNDNRWFYSRSKNGPWADLPRDRYPRETRFKGRDGRQDRDRDHDNRGRDDRDRDDRDHGDRDRDDRDRYDQRR